MPNTATVHLVRRHAVAFVLSFLSLTAMLVANYLTKRLPDLAASGASSRAITEFVLLSLPFMVAMTLPMGVFLGAMWVFTRLGAKGALAVAQREPGGLRRLLTPAIAVAVVAAAITFGVVTQILPRTNTQLSAMAAGGGVRERAGREMTIEELRAAVNSARADTGQVAASRAASFEVEIHKKFALAVSCIVMALVAAAIVLVLPRGGVVLVIGASSLVFAFVYVGLIAGESLAVRSVISPFVAMWASNGLLLTVALLTIWASGRWARRGAAEPRPDEAASGASLSGRTPLSLRIAAILCALNGVLRVGAAGFLAIRWIPGPERNVITLGVGGIAGLLMCVAAVWSWQRRRRGLVVVAMVWLLPMVVVLVVDRAMSAPSILATIALLILWSNRHQFR